MSLPAIFAAIITYIRGELDSCKTAWAIFPGVQRRGLTSAIFVPLGVGYSWTFPGAVCSMTFASSTLEMRSPCGATSLVRGRPGLLQSAEPTCRFGRRGGLTAAAAWRLAAAGRGCQRRRRYVMSNWAMRALMARMQKIAPHLPVCLLGSLFQRARMNVCRHALPCLSHASVSFLSSFPKSEIRLLLCVLPSDNSIDAF